MRCIDADKLIMKDLGNGNYIVTAEAIADARTFEAEPVKYGHWTLETDEGKAICYHCSVCDSDSHYTGVKVASKYCPTCGAKMDFVKGGKWKGLTNYEA